MRLSLAHCHWSQSSFRLCSRCYAPSPTASILPLDVYRGRPPVPPAPSDAKPSATRGC